MIAKLIAIVALLVSASAAPVHQPVKRALPRLGGVNLAGCEFGINTDGWGGNSYCPGTDQITHFVQKGANLIRIPFAWQYMVGNNQASTTLDAAYFSQFDNLVQASLKAGAYVMLDLHNYARWNGGIVGQGGPSNDQFASVWKLLATKYKDQSKIIFGVMNEPHDVPDNTKWAASVQAAVSAIRGAGANSQSIALPGNFWAHAEDWLSGANAPLLNVKDPATGDNSLLILDVHKYLDSDGSGTHTECTTNGIDTWTSLKNFLKTNGRKAIISEIGSGNTASCYTNLDQTLKYLADNADVYTGFAIWSAGSFSSSYELSIVPTNGQDNQLFVKAIQPHLPGASGAAPVTSVAPASSKAPVSSSKAVVPSSSAKPVVTSSAKPVVTSSAKPVVTSSAKPIVTSSTKPVVTSSAAPIVTSKAPVASSSTSKAGPIASSSKPASSPAPSASAGNLQKYTGALGGFAAPAVTKTGNTYTTNGRTFNFLGDALQGSCYAQMDKCQNAANQGGNKGDLTVGACTGQVQACLALASA